MQAGLVYLFRCFTIGWHSIRYLDCCAVLCRAVLCCGFYRNTMSHVQISNALSQSVSLDAQLL